MSEVPIAYQADVMLLAWGDSNTRGRTITLQLNNEGDGHPFASSQTKSGKTAGQRYAIVMVEIGADERPVEKTAAQTAWLLCKDPAFWHFLQERSFADIHDEDSARAHVCEGCGITSRSALDKDHSARMAWLTLFANPWATHQAALIKKALQ